MNANHEQNIKTRIAIPYYGTLCLPPSGLERIYFVADIAPGSSSVDGMKLKVWNPRKEPDLSRWFREQGVAGVICNDSTTPSHVALDAEGIWVILRQDGEAAELAERWARGEIARGAYGSAQSNAQEMVPTLKFPELSGRNGL